MPLALAFLDYFDSVEINAVLNALVSAGVATKYVELIANSNEGMSTTINLFDKKLSIPIRKGVRQGDTIFPKLISTALEDAMRQLGWNEEHDWEDGTDVRGINFDGKVLTNIRFADDIVLFSSSTTELSSMLNDLDEVGKKIGLKMNVKKTQWMKKRFCDQGKVTLESATFKRSHPTPTLAAKRAGWAAFNSIKEVTSQLKNPKLRAHIFEASIIPAISYGAEVWPDTKKNATALRTYRALERALLGTTRFEQWKKEQRSTDLRQRSQIRDLEEHIQRGKHRCGGHVIRRQHDRWSTRLTHWIPRNIKRPLGRPPTRWTDYFRKNISQPGRHWMTVAQVRAAWRTNAFLAKSSIKRHRLFKKLEMKLFLAFIGFLPLANTYGLSMSVLKPFNPENLISFARPLKVGDLIYISAYAKADESNKKVIVNLYEGDFKDPVKKKRISLSILVKLDSGKTSLNTLSSKGWYEDVSKKSPIKSGRDFVLQILADVHDYQIFINGKLFLRYSHRRKFKDAVTHIGIQGIIFTTRPSNLLYTESYQRGDGKQDGEQLMMFKDGYLFQIFGPIAALTSKALKEGRD
ncbi:unnamed protein product [Caenorhabditis auriculariae]|uniref:Reverse transcriptase domain-containing protein n=1 Tax=Caenorhabditis auriculariae TaxID=2777116 RepID=A0A8S1H263_9PELO|nr:unnamed protein product [Caenorhabditis auriculariae]